MFEITATVQNEAGIHCRPSAILVKAGIAYEGKIRLQAEGGECDLSSALELIVLGLEKGAGVTIQVDGPDEEKFAAELAALFETHFDFPPR